MKELKLIWDFRGSDAAKIAEHHVVHLNQYIALENLTLKVTGTEVLGEFHVIAFLVVTEHEMPKVRDALKPHRAQLYK